MHRLRGRLAAGLHALQPSAPCGDESRPRDAERVAYRRLFDALCASRRAPRARALARLAVKDGLWADPLQLPEHFVPYVSARPIHDRSISPVCAMLEKSFEPLRREVERALHQGAGAFPLVREREFIARGEWNQVVLSDSGRVFQQNCVRFPATWAAIRALPDVLTAPGLVTLSLLAPGTHVRPHFGPSNARLRIHLPLVVSPHCYMRVGREYVQWKAGECLVIDDSFEHEVWNRGRGSRVVLIVDIWHPELRERDRRSILDETRFDRAVAKFMNDRGLTRIVDEGDRVRCSFDATSEREAAFFVSAGELRS